MLRFIDRDIITPLFPDVDNSEDDHPGDWGVTRYCSIPMQDRHEALISLNTGKTYARGPCRTLGASIASGDGRPS